MAEACLLLAGGGEVRVIENVKAFDWLALDDGELAFEVRAEVIDRAAGHYAARVGADEAVQRIQLGLCAASG